MNNPPRYLTASERERWAYAEGIFPISELSTNMTDMELEIEGLNAENDRLLKENDSYSERISELEEELDAVTT